jgi:HEPN domain-containing protein
VAKDLDPPKTHDLARLAQLAGEEIQSGLDDADLAELTRWSIDGRYPSDIEDPTRDDAHRAVRDATLVVEFVRGRLRPPG